MDRKETNPKIKTDTEVGPEVATRSLGVSLGRKVLSDIVLGFSALTVIGVLKVLQSHNDDIVLYGLETFTTAALSIWLISLLLSVIPNDLYERMSTIEKFSFKQIAIGVSGIASWYAAFFFVSHFVDSTVAGLGMVAGN
ncbi:hypothetical protein [Roseobacter sp. N2S]|uniref:hypothetical protein n=1 Tax=Roseobacter sp. N2S TaxID=2663844 RepID=UPI0028621F85|nr:hypothetical protein [Roseobacter sp. N2S]MDR6266496.1 hypothetical protein [Roseobacter sp. N2S]